MLDLESELESEAAKEAIVGDRSRYRKLEDLYVEGVEVELKGGLVVYLKPLNSLQKEEARGHAQAARSRIVLALRDDESDEYARFEAQYDINTRSDVIHDLALIEANQALPKIMDEVRSDPDWKERMEVLERHSELPEPTEDETRVVAKINTQYLEEVRRRMDEEEEHARLRLERLDDEALRIKFMEQWVDRRGTDFALTEYGITEIMYAARACEGVKDEDGEWDHSACDSHSERVWETRNEVRALAEPLLEALTRELDALNLSEREGKGSGSRPSSSASSESTSQPVESAPSTPEATSATPPTSSSVPLPTP